jgi:hypothetical protein
MRRIKPADEGWVDIFESDYFTGRMRRLFGPLDLNQLQAGSVIVGPRTTLELSVRRGGKHSVVMIQPKKLVPVLAKSVVGEVTGARVRYIK